MEKTSGLERKSGWNNIKELGVVYGLTLGSTTLGAIGGAIYSLFTKDYSFGQCIATGALLGAAVEPGVILGGIIQNIDVW
ncbi:MAG: hypothetical protein Q7S06_00445 [Nanoarchaeota archaeon]|nr:hypothetical protein [Nanoarchaeota archaeon]